MVWGIGVNYFSDTESIVKQPEVVSVPSSQKRLRLLVVDLNQFTSFPTLSIGLMVAALRRRGHGVQVICPLALDVHAAERERRETVLDYFHTRIRLSDISGVRALRDIVRGPREWLANRPRKIVMTEVEKALGSADAVLLSAYLHHIHVVEAVGRKAAECGVPVLLGGPMFNLNGVSDAWRNLPGIHAIVGGEVDRSLPDIVEALCGAGDLLAFPGVTLSDGRRSAAAPPLRDLDETPIPDFDDFPWDRYPTRIIPILSGRGCQWDKCMFCSDVISASGRTFRTRSLANVLIEMETQADRYGTKNFLFLDLKLNSFPELFRGLAREIRNHVRDAEWIGTVHVDQRKDNGLSRRDLFAATAGGMRRVSFGLETGSQALLDRMKKGSSVERNAVFLRDAHDAGLSIRCTMFRGFPGETSADMEATADFLEAHGHYIDRIRFNDFAIAPETPIHDALASAPESPLRRVNSTRALVLYRPPKVDRRYRRAKARALRVVHEINRKVLRETSRQFDGLM